MMNLFSNKNRLIYIFFGICFCLLSCKSRKLHCNKKDILNFFKEEYVLGKNELNDSLTNFLPLEIDCEDINEIFLINSSARNIPKDIMYITMNKTIDKQDEIIIAKNQEKVEVKNLSDSCLIFIDYNADYYGFDMIKYDRYKCPTFVPVPNKKLFGIDKYPEDIIFYVKDYLQGKFTDNLKILNRDYLPNDWKRGYTRGYALSESQKTIFYWIIIW